MPHKDHRSGNNSTASAFKEALATLQSQLAGTPLVTKELVAVSTQRVAKRARSFSVSSAAAEEAGSSGTGGRTRQRSIDYTVDALIKKEHKAGVQEVPEADEADAEVRETHLKKYVGTAATRAHHMPGRATPTHVMLPTG